MGTKIIPKCIQVKGSDGSKYNQSSMFEANNRVFEFDYRVRTVSRGLKKLNHGFGSKLAKRYFKPCSSTW